MQAHHDIMWPLTVFLLYAITLNVVAYQYELSTDVDLAGKTCPAERMLFDVDAPSKIACAVKCGIFGDTCAGISYQKSSRKCIGCAPYSCTSTVVYQEADTNFYKVKQNSELDGHLFRIHAMGNDRFWHENGLGDKRISSRAQPDDQYVKFSFVQQNDGSYKIGVRGIFVYDVDGDENILSSKFNSDPDSSTFCVTKETDVGFRVRAKRNGRLVRLDEDRFVSTRYDIDDEMSKFYLVEA